MYLLGPGPRRRAPRGHRRVGRASELGPRRPAPARPRCRPRRRPGRHPGGDEDPGAGRRGRGSEGQAAVRGVAPPVRDRRRDRRDRGGRSGGRPRLRGRLGRRAGRRDLRGRADRERLVRRLRRAARPRRAHRRARLRARVADPVPGPRRRQRLVRRGLLLRSRRPRRRRQGGRSRPSRRQGHSGGEHRRLVSRPARRRSPLVRRAARRWAACAAPLVRGRGGGALGRRRRRRRPLSAVRRGGRRPPPQHLRVPRPRARSGRVRRRGLASSLRAERRLFPTRTQPGRGRREPGSRSTASRSKACSLVPHEGEAPYPLIVCVHGGPTGAWRWNFLPAGSPGPLLAQDGYAVLLPNPRGSGGRGQEFARANLGDMGGGDLQDILAGVDALVEDGIVDTERVGVTGGSYGGFMSAWAVTQTDRFARLDSARRVTDWTSFHHTTNIGHFDALFLARRPERGRRRVRRALAGLPGEELQDADADGARRGGSMRAAVSQATEMYNALDRGRLRDRARPVSARGARLPRARASARPVGTDARLVRAASRLTLCASAGSKSR